jgi:homoserine kinase
MPAAEGAAPAPKAKMPMMGGMGSSTAIIVTGGTNNNYYSVGGMRYSQSVQIDRWR